MLLGSREFSFLVLYIRWFGYKQGMFVNDALQEMLGTDSTLAAHPNSHLILRQGKSIIIVIPV